jgi:hypothetical protein
MKLFEVARAYEEIKEKMKAAREELDKELRVLPLNSYHQDPTTLAVYKIVKPTGTYVEFRELGYERTVIGEEKRGSLSKKEAEEQGFDLKKRE